MGMVRKAKDSDLDKIKDLVEKSTEAEMYSDLLDSNFKQMLKSEIVLVAEQENEFIGVCFGIANSKMSLAEIMGLVVSKKYRKSGIARKLVNEFEKMAKKKKAKTVVFNSNPLQTKLFSHLKYKHGKPVIPYKKSLL